MIKTLTPNNPVANFNHRNLPFIYQYETYSPAWPPTTRIGFYIDPSGRKFRYRNPVQWKSYISETNNKDYIDRGLYIPKMNAAVWGSETDGMITPEDLFFNLQLCIKGWNFIKPRSVKLSSHIIKEMLHPTFDYQQSGIIDGSMVSESLYVYDSELQTYKRILLKFDGIDVIRNQSEYANKVLKIFARY